MGDHLHLVKADARDMRNKQNSLVPLKLGEQEFDNIVPDAAQYGRVQFWDERYLVETEPFEWYHGYDYYRDPILENIELEKKVLVAGCGTSNMPEDMAEDGYTDVIAQDISRIAIKNQIARTDHIESIKCVTGNMTDMDLEDEEIEAVIDKALLDSLFCSDNGETDVAQYVNEVIRILSPTGVFIVISRMIPEEALPMLEQFDIEEPYYTPWLIEVQAMLKPKEFEGERLDPDDPESLYWVYICRKKEVMVTQKKIKENKLKLKKKKAGKKATIKAPNL
jgi:SAM-dependent methyltransferase